MKLSIVTTMPNPRVISWTPDAGQRGWKIHLTQLGTRTTDRIGQGKIDVSPALCGLRPRHGWGLDMFIEDFCARCVLAARLRGLEIPK